MSVTPTNTAKPGDTLTIWGTGLGPTLNNGGDTTTPPAGNIGTAPQVFVGGVASPSVTYWGRSPGIFPGLDQIQFRGVAERAAGMRRLGGGGDCQPGNGEQRSCHFSRRHRRRDVLRSDGGCHRGRP
jgi:hypothetical protein